MALGLRDREDLDQNTGEQFGHGDDFAAWESELGSGDTGSSRLLAGLNPSGRCLGREPKARLCCFGRQSIKGAAYRFRAPSVLVLEVIRDHNLQ